MTFNDKVYALARAIPHGKVQTYGGIARLLGEPRAAREVGWAMNACDPKTVPWQRVINAQGKISPRGFGDSERIQRERLEAEGVVFGVHDQVDLKVYLWEPSDIEVRVILDDASKPLAE
jgi:methylated-DNA-protein-cysteine methyltransferase-like protein